MASINYPGIRDDLKSIIGLLQKLDDTMVRYLDSRQNSMHSCSQQFVEADVDLCLEDVHNAKEMAQSEADSDFANGNSNSVAMSEVCTKIGTSLNTVPFDSTVVSKGSFEIVDSSLDTTIVDETNLQNNATQVFDKTPKWQKSCFLSAVLTAGMNYNVSLSFSNLQSWTSPIKRFEGFLNMTVVFDLMNSRRNLSLVATQCMLFSFPFDPGLYTVTNMSSKVRTKRICLNMSLGCRKLQNGVKLLLNFDGLLDAEAVWNLVNCRRDSASHILFEINSQRCSYLVVKLLLGQYVHGVIIGVEGNGIVERPSLEFINYPGASNLESEGSYGILAFYHIVGGYSCYLNHKNSGLVRVPTSLGMFLLWKTTFLQVSMDMFYLFAYANSMTKVWDPGWKQYGRSFILLFEFTLAILNSLTFGLCGDDKRELLIELATRMNPLCFLWVLWNTWNVHGPWIL